MVKQVKQSLIIRTGVALVSILVLAVINMLLSFQIAESAEKDAARINLAGSLRMQAYRISNSLLLPSPEQIEDRRRTLISGIEDFDSRLYRPVLAHYIRRSGDEMLQASFVAVENYWQQIKSKLLVADKERVPVLRLMDNFVVEINGLVKNLERQTERKFHLLRLTHALTLILSIAIVLWAFFHIYYRVVIRLQSLVDMAAKIRGGDFSIHVDSRGEDELSLLATTFNDMVDSLESMYNGLEDKVENQTLHLHRMQQGLRLLYEVSRNLSSGNDLVERLGKTAEKLKQYFQLDRVDIFMAKDKGDHPFLVSSDKNTGPLLANIDPCIETLEQERQYLKLPMERGEDSYGYVLLNGSQVSHLGAEQNTLLAAFLDTIVSALAHEQQSDQQYRLALMQERATIARELHDSLAQSLSYTKIQISRLQLLQQQNAGLGQINEAIDEIRSGIQAAYRQLREVLATFRLQLDAPGLQSSLEKTAIEFNIKGDVQVSLVYKLENFPLTPNEEIHVLQIVREALSNVLRHSTASRAEIALTLNESAEVEVTINDDGCGFGDLPSGPNHYGITIMNERAGMLGGVILLSDLEPNGAQVKLKFKSARLPGQPRSTNIKA